MQNEANVQNSCRQTLQRRVQTQFVQAQQRTLKEIARVQAELAKKRQLENTAVIFFRSLYISTTRKEEAQKKQMEQEREKSASLRFAEESPLEPQHFNFQRPS